MQSRRQLREKLIKEMERIKGIDGCESIVRRNLKNRQHVLVRELHKKFGGDCYPCPQSETKAWPVMEWMLTKLGWKLIDANTKGPDRKWRLPDTLNSELIVEFEREFEDFFRHKHDRNYDFKDVDLVFSYLPYKNEETSLIKNKASYPTISFVDCLMLITKGNRKKKKMRMNGEINHKAHAFKKKRNNTNSVILRKRNRLS